MNLWTTSLQAIFVSKYSKIKFDFLYAARINLHTMGPIKILAMSETMEKIRKEINIRTLRKCLNRSFVFEKMVFVSFVVSRFLFDVRWPAAPIRFISERRLKYRFRLLLKWFRWNRSNRMNAKPKQTKRPRKISNFIREPSYHSTLFIPSKNSKYSRAFITIIDFKSSNTTGSVWIYLTKKREKTIWIILRLRWSFGSFVSAVGNRLPSLALSPTTTTNSNRKPKKGISPRLATSV